MRSTVSMRVPSRSKRTASKRASRCARVRSMSAMLPRAFPHLGGAERLTTAEKPHILCYQHAASLSPRSFEPQEEVTSSSHGTSHRDRDDDGHDDDPARVRARMRWNRAAPALRRRYALAGHHCLSLIHISEP